MSARWDSAKFWRLFTDDVVAAAVDADGEPIVFREQPIRDESCGVWTGCLGYSVECLALTDVPSGDQWRESLILRPYEWRVPDESTPMDAKVWERSEKGEAWSKAHLAELPTRVWEDGDTSWTAETKSFRCPHIVLVNPTNPNQPPPLDWEPPKPETKGA